MSNLTSVTVTAGVPTAGTGTVSTIDNIPNLAGIKIWDGTNTAVVKAASTAPATTDAALVVSISPNSVNANVTNASDAVTASATAGAPVVAYNYGFNGTTWDRLQVDGSKNLKVVGVLSPTTASTGTQTIVAGSASSVTVLAANTARLGATVFNDSTALLYLLTKTGGTASTTVYSVQVPPNGYYEVPFNYVGALIGIWASATGNARVTEYTA